MALPWLDSVIPAVGGVLSAGISSAGGLLANAGSWKKTKWAIQMQQDFQERMSNTAYQRSVKDMRAAGLNPMMMFGGSGGAASTPSGGQANITQDDVLTPALNTALAFRNQRNQDKLSKAEVENKNADTYLKGNQAQTESENFANAVKTGAYIESQTAKNLQDIAASKAMTLQNILESQSRMNLNSAQATNERYRSESYRRDYEYMRNHPIQSSASRGLKLWTDALGLGTNYSFNRH